MTTATISRQTSEHELEPGDHMDAAEFHRRYLLHPWLKKAELIDGVVYVPAGDGRFVLGAARFRLIGRLGEFVRSTPGVDGEARASYRAGPNDEPQPDVMLRWGADHGGNSYLDADGYVTGAPELVAEVSAISRGYDLHEKKELYRRMGVQEYVCWQTDEGHLDWWELVDGEYVPLPADLDGTVHSRVFPGLTLRPSDLR